MWVLHGRLPERPGFRHVALVDYMEWTTFLTVGRAAPGGIALFCPAAALLVYFGLRGVLTRAQAERGRNE